ncbi:Prolyl 4-hydroxylase, alpha subunit [Cordyceps fumosorosea ARSEF 2679]|uniref:Prolyl 4-hydroxylase, alpha subunit n=1 Tax=Cordyceps fumosorosea (strain ARSEF 2679) TaxID=1081104 RepID=A0A162JQC3_CORFA|nr:Prolyl 4-hydroxylase, alpha subunit [Cordyceps fumosorosea ARSEF 2679]OAA72222.1 Prolyl 4-hydroxylase, alpha subunit [Cordyceps fumosorosea ARSEF 2679]
MGKQKTSKAAKSQPTTTTTATPPPPPAWPRFTPRLPVVDLAPTPHPRTARVVTVDGFFPRSLCRAYVALLSTLALQTTPGTPRRGDAVRVNDRLQVHDAALAAALWERTRTSGCTGTPKASSSTVTVQARTTWTLLLYLTSAAEGCVGGETVFYPHDRQSDADAIPVAPRTGTLLLHKHGDDCLLHEGKEVRAGEKWVLRTDLCIKR